MYNFNVGYLLSRENLTSPSTHKAIIFIAALFGTSLNPEYVNQILETAASVIAFIEFARQHNIKETT